MICQCETSSVDSENGPYKTVIQFNDVDFIPDDEAKLAPSSPYVLVGSDKVHFEPLFMNKANVAVNCSCESEYFDFEKQQQRSDALYGEPRPPYIRKTTTRPPRNPMNVVGGCKHILAFADHLRRMGIIR